MLLVASVALPGAVAAATDSLSIGVEQDHETGEAIVTVTDNSSEAVSNATVTVSVDENVSYVGTDTYNTSDNGTVTLPAPNETVNVTITATADDLTASETVTLVPLEESVEMTLEVQSDGSVLGTVTQYGDAVDNATVNVTVGENQSYEGTGEYQTDENGTFSLPAPADDVTVTATTTVNTVTVSESTSLAGGTLAVSVSQEDESVIVEVTDGGEPADGATVTVESDNYTYTGEYTATNGTVSLPAPTQNVTVTVTATLGNETATTTADLTVATDDNPNNDFAEALNMFIRFLQMNGADGPLGQEISEFVHANNPSEADDERGPPEHANGHAASDDENETADADERGPPAFVEANTERNRHGDDLENESYENESYENQTHEQTEDPDGADVDSEEDPEADDDDEDDGDDERGPPEHAGNPHEE